MNNREIISNILSLRDVYDISTILKLNDLPINDVIDGIVILADENDLSVYHPDSISNILLERAIETTKTKKNSILKEKSIIKVDKRTLWKLKNLSVKICGTFYGN